MSIVQPSSSPFTESQKRDSFLSLQTHLLESTQPFFIGRLSGNETRLCGNVLSNIPVPDNLVMEMLFGAGIQFNNRFDIQSYVKSYTNACIHAQLLGVWDDNMYTQAKEYYAFISRLKRDVRYICAHALEPYYYMDLPEYAFDRVFENKKVLVITSHQKTTESQIPHLTQVFKRPLFHTTTEFYVYKPPQQNGGNHDNQSWAIHFERMKRELGEIKENTFDFDIALVSCGGFGMPISDFLFTDLKKSVIYVGGALQLFFGIQGKRWEQSIDVVKHMNAFWTRPFPEDSPKHPSICEGGCYW